MNWIEIAGIGLCVVCVPLGIVAGKWFKRLSAQYPEPTKPVVLNLGTPEMREQLRALLDHYGIVGNCDIRDGKVYTARRVGESNTVAAVLIGVYNRIVDKTSNPNLALYTVQHGTLIQLGLAVSDLREIAQLLEDASGR